MHWIVTDKKYAKLIESCLDIHGVEPACTVEEQEKVRFLLSLPEKEVTKALQELDIPYFLEEESGEVNWAKQWEEHAPHFEEGIQTIDLEPFGKAGTIEMLPGAGFGDLSHPTTFIALSLASPHVAKAVVWDIGCGSGVLAIAAAKWGAKQVFAVDIDENALLHTQKNIEQNKVEKTCLIADHFSFPKNDCLLILLNMISSEQEQVFETLPKEFPSKTKLITSGIPFEEKSLYLEKMRARGWFASQEMRYQGWLGFLFTKEPTS